MVEGVGNLHLPSPPIGEREGRARESGGHLVGGEVGAVLGGGGGGAAGGELAAGVLPCLPLVVPMEAKLRERAGHLAGLLVGELDPHPLADNLGEAEKLRRLSAEQLQHPVGGKLAILAALLEVERRQGRTRGGRCRCDGGCGGDLGGSLNGRGCGGGLGGLAGLHNWDRQSTRLNSSH